MIIKRCCLIFCSFRDESDNSFDGDVMLLLVGVGIIVAYVAVILGKFNEVEHKVLLCRILFDAALY